MLFSTATDVEYNEERFVKDLNKKCLGIHFSRASVSPQGQLCLELNRLITFSESLSRVAQEGDRYGFSDSSELTQSGDVTLGHCTCSLKLACTTKSNSSQPISMTGVGCGFHDCHGDSVSLEEGRVFVLKGVLSNILRATGYKVHYQCCMVSCMRVIYHSNHVACSLFRSGVVTVVHLLVINF